jgi:hypothetical protein
MLEAKEAEDDVMTSARDGASKIVLWSPLFDWLRLVAASTEHDVPKTICLNAYSSTCNVFCTCSINILLHTLSLASVSGNHSDMNRRDMQTNKLEGRTDSKIDFNDGIALIFVSSFDTSIILIVLGSELQLSSYFISHSTAKPLAHPLAFVSVVVATLPPELPMIFRSYVDANMPKLVPPDPTIGRYFKDALVNVS